MKVKSYPYWLMLFVASLLSTIAWIRTDFSLEKISAPLSASTYKEEELSDHLKGLLSQSYQFLAKGRQSFVFVSDDQATVIKFFNKKYFETPWYSWFFPQVIEKRKQRQTFYENSYCLAEQLFPKETALLYVHLNKTKNLPKIQLKDRANRDFEIDLNRIPFVLQRRGESLYPFLLQQNDPQTIKRIVHEFLDVIAHRMTQGIADNDQDVELNFGVLDEKLFHLDPGRLFRCDFSSKERRDLEWWRSTHRFQKWIAVHYPELLPFFEEQKRSRQRAFQGV